MQIGQKKSRYWIYAFENGKKKLHRIANNIVGVSMS